MALSLPDYVPQDRRAALARGEPLPDRAHGSALFADISGFTPLTEKLAQQFGARRGTEEFTQRMNLVYDALISAVEQHAGSVVNFAGDAIICWFDDLTPFSPFPRKEGGQSRTNSRSDDLASADISGAR